MLARIEDAIEDIRQGRFIIIVDDENRENEGDLAIAAEKVTPDAVNFMAREGRGLICMPLTGERLDELAIPLMVQDNTSKNCTAFTVSIEAKRGVTTGISAADRATTVVELSFASYNNNSEKSFLYRGFEVSQLVLNPY